MPKFIKKPNNIETLEYEDIKFETMVSGKPTPTCEWFKGEVKLEPSDRIIYTQVIGRS